MVFTNSGKQFVAWALGSQVTNNYISYINIGNGSGTALVTNSILINETDRNPITGSPDFSQIRKAIFQADFNSVEMSGTTLTEFGLLASGPSLVGSVWLRESFGSVVFDGTNELQIITTLEVL